jgi:hypothetical protein
MPGCTGSLKGLMPMLLNWKKILLPGFARYAAILIRLMYINVPTANIFHLKSSGNLIILYSGRVSCHRIILVLKLKECFRRNDMQRRLLLEENDEPVNESSSLSEFSEGFLGEFGKALSFGLSVMLIVVLLMIMKC